MNKEIRQVIGEFTPETEAKDRIYKMLLQTETKCKSVKSTRTFNRRVVVFAAAAAVLGTGALSAAAYSAGYRIEGGELVRRFYGEDAERLIGDDAVNDTDTVNNEHFEISMYSYLTDGRTYSALWCIEAEDEEAGKKLNGLGEYNVPNVQVRYSNGDAVNSSYSVTTDKSLNNDSHYYFYIRGVFDGNSDRDVTFTVNTNGTLGISDDEFRLLPDDYTELEIISEDDKLSEGLNFTVTTSSNVKAEKLVGENGVELDISPLGITYYYIGIDKPFECRAPQLIYSDGHRETSGDCEIIQTENGWYYNILSESDKLLDTDEIIGVEIDGVEYLK